MGTWNLPNLYAQNMRAQSKGCWHANQANLEYWAAVSVAVSLGSHTGMNSVTDLNFHFRAHFCRSFIFINMTTGIIATASNIHVATTLYAACHDQIFQTFI